MDLGTIIGYVLAWGALAYGAYHASHGAIAAYIKPGEILLGKATYPLVKDAVKAGRLESIPVKGKTQPIAPFRLEHVEAGAAPGRPVSPAA